ncbi:response regulator [Cellulosimicrobium sp. Marseille-Q8652]
MIRVVVVDDEQLFREGITRLVDSASDMSVVGEAADGHQGVAQVMAHRPDVVLMDMQMPVMDGLSATQEILRSAPTTAVVVLTAFQSDRYVLPALRMGASGYLLKSSSVEELQAGIRAAAHGEAMLSPSVTRRLLDAMGPSLLDQTARAQAQVASLSRKERDVLACVGEGMANADIARRLYIAEPTVKVHLRHALEKIGASNRIQAAIIAHDADLHVSDKDPT